MAWRPVPLASGHYTDNARPWANQEVVNWLPVKPERPGTRSELMLRDVPGLRPFSVVGTGPIRGAHNAEGTLFVVSGTGLYRISPLGVASSLGTIPGVGRVSMAHNQVTGGNQVVVANGSAAYVYDTSDDTFTQITDEGFPGAKSVRFLGQMILYVEPFGRFWGSSDLADATSYNTIFRQEAEGSPDLILHVEPSQGEALVFGKRTIEVWSNQVTENANFQRTTVIERGAASGNAIVTLDNSCIFLGDDGILYRLNGYTPVPISTRPLEFKLKDYDLSKAFAFTWEDAGFKVVYFTIPGGLTWGYDVATGELHRRESYGLDRWRLNTLTPFNRKWIGGDFADGTLWELDWDYHKEGCDEIVRLCRPPMMHNGGNRVRVNGLRFNVDMGEAADPLEASITGTLPDGPAGEVVNYQYTIAGYVEGDEVSGVAVTSGALPEGLSISTTGLVTGTREGEGVYTFTIAGTDRCGNAVSLSDTSETTGFTISGDLLTGYSGESDTGSYTNTNGFGAITYAVLSGTFPAGLTLATDGTWSGTRTSVGSYSWVVQATDAAGNTATVADTADILDTDFFIVSYADTAADETVVIVDGTTHVASSPITVDNTGGNGKAIMSRDFTRVFVSCRTDGTVKVIDVATRAVVHTINQAGASGMACDDDYLYVVGFTSDVIVKYLLTDYSVAATSADLGFNQPDDMALSADGTQLLVTGNGCHVVDKATLTIAATAAIPGGGHTYCACNPVTAVGYVSDSASSKMYVVDLTDGSFTDVTVNFCQSIDTSPDGTKVYALELNGGLREYNASTMAFIREIAAGGANAWSMCLSSGGNQACVTFAPGTSVNIVDLTTEVVTNVTVGIPSRESCSRPRP